jgi:enterochelin esterase family protein
MVVVMTNGNVALEAAPGQSSLGFAKPARRLPHVMDGKMEETFPEVVAFIDANYRTLPKKNARAIAGLSMGGFHSMSISRSYPDTFDYVGLFSPATSPASGAQSALYRDIDGALRAQMQKGYKLYWIGIGKTDFLYEAVKAYRARLDSIQMPYVYRETEGGHTWSNWRAYLAEFLPLLFQ